jgi:hypothetical protein
MPTFSAIVFILGYAARSPKVNGGEKVAIAGIARRQE